MHILEIYSSNLTKPLVINCNTHDDAVQFMKSAVQGDLIKVSDHQSIWIQPASVTAMKITYAEEVNQLEQNEKLPEKEERLVNEAAIAHQQHLCDE